VQLFYDSIAKVGFSGLTKYFDTKDLNDYNQNIVLELTRFLAKNLSTDSRALTHEKNLFDTVKKSLPIIPKYKTDKKFYLFDSIYISSEYKPKLLIENIAKENEFDFSKYNFLSDAYLEDKRLTDFIKNIIDEQEKNKNKRTIEFFTEYSNILLNYLLDNINHYKKVFDFLIEIQEDNKDKISKIPLLLTQNDIFYNSTQTIYFSNDSDSNLDVLNEELFQLVQSEPKYKEFLENIFKVKEADILNIILNEYLPWIRKSYQNRTSENDEQLLRYIKDIIENFDKFEQDQKQNIRNGLYFISSNQENKYLKSSDIYLSQNLTEIIFNSNSIEKYITDKSYFDFLNDNYNSLISTIDEVKVKDFFRFFSFEKHIKENDIPSFIKFMKQDLDLNLNIEALEFIAKSIDSEDRKKIKEIENFKVYSQNKNLIEMKNIFQVQVNNLKIDYIHTSYKEKISDLYFKNIKQYFQSENKIESFIDYLKKDINFDEAVKVYQYLDSKSNFDPNKKQNHHYTITTEKIRKEFKNSKLIYNNNSSDKFYPTDVTWKEEKSANKLFALSTIYPQELQNFFIKKVQVSQSKNIKQIINQIKEMKEKNDDYFDLLIDLNDLIIDDNELNKYDKSFNNSIHEQYDKNINENAKQFILKKEQIFILDDGKKNRDEKFYFIDLEIDNYDEKLDNKIFTVNDKYPVEHYNNLVNTLKIKRLSNLEKSYANRQFKENYNIQDYRLMLDYAYDLLFTKFPDEYKKLEDREVELKELNLINTINVHQDIVSQITLDGIRIELNKVKYYFKSNELFIVNTNELFKIIAEKIGSISDDNIDIFYRNVIEGNRSKSEYCKEKNIKEKQHFTLEISDETVENTKTDIADENNFNIDEDSDNSEKDTESDNNQKNDQSAEDERKERQNTDKNIGDHDTDYDELDEEINPDSIDPKKHKENLEKQENEKQIREDSRKAEENISNKISSNPKTKSFSNTKSKIEEKSVNSNYQPDSPIDSNLKKQSIITIIKDDYIKEKLYSEYKGYCQICAFTFVKSGHKNSFEAFNWTDRRVTKNADRKIIFANSLSLCRNCAANIKFGQFKSLFLNQKNSIEGFKAENIENIMQKLHDIIDENIPEKFQLHIEFGDMYGLAIELNNKERNIYFTPKHYVEFIALMQGE